MIFLLDSFGIHASFRDEGIFLAFSAILYPSLLKSWKLSWREGGEGAKQMFDTEDGMQVSAFNLRLKSVHYMETSSHHKL